MIIIIFIIIRPIDFIIISIIIIIIIIIIMSVALSGIKALRYMCMGRGAGTIFFLAGGGGRAKMLICLVIAKI